MVDEDTLTKAIKWQTELDSVPRSCMLVEPTTPFQPPGLAPPTLDGTHSYTSLISLAIVPNESFAKNLGKLGICLGNNTGKVETFTLSLKPVIHDSLDLGQQQQIAPLSYNPNDDEDIDLDNTLLAHLVDELANLDLDEVNLDTRLCDLLVPSKKSKYCTWLE